MLIFFDESFRNSLTQPTKALGIMSGIGISEQDLYTVMADVFQLKIKHFGIKLAKEMELKGKNLFSQSVFKIQKNGIQSVNLAFGLDLFEYIASKHFPVFGCVCFEEKLKGFQCQDVKFLR